MNNFGYEHFQVIDPLYRELESFPHELPEDSEKDIEYKPQLEHCSSRYLNVWLGRITTLLRPFTVYSMGNGSQQKFWSLVGEKKIKNSGGWLFLDRKTTYLGDNIKNSGGWLFLDRKTTYLGENIYFLFSMSKENMKLWYYVMLWNETQMSVFFLINDNFISSEDSSPIEDTASGLT